ncbi:MAG: GNAT family N-acetyltransferase [Rhodospirillales bacterium]|nr:GNAT family N-acetyltransferase [Rhodospirillales bacterium]
MHPVLRPLGALDLDRAAAMHGEAFVPFGERGWTRQEMAELLASPGVAGLLLEIDGVDVGMAICRVVADESELITIAVRPAHRRRGAARRLLAAVLDQVRAAGARSLFLEVATDNPAALRLYELSGFCVVGNRPAYFRRGDGPAADAYVMRLDLG